MTSLPVISDTLRALGGVETFLEQAAELGRALVPASPTRELAIVTGAAIAAAQGRDLRVVADPDVLPRLARRTGELGIVVEHWFTPVRFTASPDREDTAVLVVVNDQPAQTSRAGRVIADAVTDAAEAGRVVVRRSAANTAAQAVVAGYPHAVYAPGCAVPSPRPGT